MCVSCRGIARIGAPQYAERWDIEAILRREFTLETDVTCPFCGKEQTLAAAYGVPGHCVQCLQSPIFQPEAVERWNTDREIHEAIAGLKAAGRRLVLGSPAQVEARQVCRELESRLHFPFPGGIIL